jgi:hypothetical protein
VCRGVAFGASPVRRQGTLVLVWAPHQERHWVVLTDVPRARGHLLVRLAGVDRVRLLRAQRGGLTVAADPAHGAHPRGLASADAGGGDALGTALWDPRRRCLAAGPASPTARQAAADPRPGAARPWAAAAREPLSARAQPIAGVLAPPAPVASAVAGPSTLARADAITVHQLSSVSAGGLNVVRSSIPPPLSPMGRGEGEGDGKQMTSISYAKLNRAIESGGEGI